ncbi:hypothetical protein HMPREF0731_2548, partial [Pseudoroseomonas cervicalis ATCC 49957]
GRAPPRRSAPRAGQGDGRAGSVGSWAFLHRRVLAARPFGGRVQPA